jgi:hypothetical protein
VLARSSLALALVAASVLMFAEPAASAPNWPDSYFFGPAGKRIILPPKKGVLVGLAAGGPRQINKRQRFIGRRLDIEHRFYGDCTFPTSGANEIVSHRRIPMISWSGPKFSPTQIVNGEADACFREFGAGLAAWDRRLFLRIYWEFNGDWFPWSGTGDLFVSAWRRTVSVLRGEGVRKASFVWCPGEGHDHDTTESYPGNQWVDWVCSDGYNWNKSDAWCGGWYEPYHPGWCQFHEIFDDGARYEGNRALSVHHYLGRRKPYMVGETGTVEDTNRPGRKGRWFRKARDKIKARFRHLHAFVYLDYDTSPNEGCCNWRLDTSQSSLRGFRALARDSYFWTRR